MCGDFQGCLVAELVDTLFKSHELCKGYSCFLGCMDASKNDVLKKLTVCDNFQGCLVA